MPRFKSVRRGCVQGCVHREYGIRAVCRRLRAFCGLGAKPDETQECYVKNIFVRNGGRMGGKR